MERRGGREEEPRPCATLAIARAFYRIFLPLALGRSEEGIQHAFLFFGVTSRCDAKIPHCAFLARSPARPPACLPRLPLCRIYYTTPEQKEIALASKAAEQAKLDK